MNSAAQPNVWKPSPVTPRRVLVVDDNPGSTQVMALMLKKFWGHTVETAGDGRQALEKAASFTPEVVLLDIGLPDMDGYSVARALRAAAGTAEALLVAITGYSGEQERRKAIEAGFDEHMTKPAAAQDLELLFKHPRLNPGSER
ncbi:MAG: response regulator [Pirellulales bacterium]